MKILIDAGHGIDTPGKRSPDGSFREYLWNRQVADLVIEGLRASGMDADLVVTETNDITLRTRAMRVNKVCDRMGAGNVLLVSIHANAAGNGKSWMNGKGWSCYTTPGKTKGDALAECFYDVFAKAFPDRRMRRDLSDGDSDIEASFYILVKTRCPAVLLENFFYDNVDDVKYILSDEGREMVIKTHVDGIINYIKSIK